MNFATTILLAAAAAAPAVPAVKQGVDLWQAGDYERAVQTWRQPAQAGDADAQFNLAQAYKLGRGVPADMRQAEGWYRKAAAQNHAQAGAMLGLIMFQNGDRRGAMPWLQKAADQGDPRAQYVMGTALFNGDIVTRDWPRAYAMMTRAAAAGLPQASSSLTQMDQFMPLTERRRGLALAKGDGGRGLRTEISDAVPPPPPPAVRPTELPPSRVAEGASPPLAAPKPAARRAGLATQAPVAAAPKPVAPVVAAAAVAPKPVAKPAAAGGGSWRIQLGAYGDPAAARAAWERMSRQPGLGALRPTMVKAGAVTRLQAGPFASRAAAAQACRSAGAACFPVAG